VQQAIQDQAVSTDPLAFHARYQEAKELPFVSDADTHAKSTTICLAACWLARSRGSTTTIFRVGKMVRRQAVIWK